MASCDAAALQSLGLRVATDCPGLTHVLRRQLPQRVVAPVNTQPVAAPACPIVQAASSSSARPTSSSSASKPVSPPKESKQPADVKPRIFPAGCTLQQPGHSFSVLTYNVLLPNSVDGWWIYKYYRDPGAFAEWPSRQALLKQQLLSVSADVICLQEVSDQSFEQDFSFLCDAGYVALMHEKKGRMRPATFWKKDGWELLGAQHRDRTLVTALKRTSGPDVGAVVFVVNAHLTAGQSADRRLRQAEEALSTVAKEVKRLGLGAAAPATIFCGDFNSQGQTGVRELLTAGEVGPEFRESGDPTERGQEDKQITSKTKKQSIGQFQDAAEVAFGPGSAPSTILATNIDSKMLKENGDPTPALLAAVDAAFAACCSEGRSVMLKADVDRYLLKINRELGRGSEYRFVVAAMEKRGVEEFHLEDFRALYVEELHEGKFWGVEHDLRVMNGAGLAVPSEGPCELRFDYLFYTQASLQLVGVQEPLSEAQRKTLWGEPWEVLPNSWHPSDHLPVAATFAFGC